MMRLWFRVSVNHLFRRNNSNLLRLRWSWWQIIVKREMLRTLITSLTGLWPVISKPNYDQMSWVIFCGAYEFTTIIWMMMMKSSMRSRIRIPTNKTKNNKNQKRNKKKLRKSPLWRKKGNQISQTTFWISLLREKQQMIWLHRFVMAVMRSKNSDWRTVESIMSFI